MSQLEAATAYRAIVFALKPGITWNTCAEGKKLFQYRNVVLAEHPPEPDGQCEWDGLHYHGLVEHPAKYRFDSDRIFNKFKENECEWFKSETCKLPVNYLAYMAIPPRKQIYVNCRDENSDLDCLLAQVTPEMVEEAAKKKKERTTWKQEGCKDVMYLKDLILKTGVATENQLVPLYSDCDRFISVYCKRTFQMNFQKALAFAHLQTTDMSIRDLSINWEDKFNQCMSPQESALLIERWCSFQNIDPQQFISDVINVMDKCYRKKNTLILQGAPNSGKTFIAKSLEKAAIFYSEISQGIAGYSFMWQDCVNKRLIVINEPYFDRCMIEELKMVLEGTGLFVKQKMKGDAYLKPTPVIITTNNDIWRMCPEAKSAITARCLRIYDQLQACDYLKDITKDLHPRWINLLAIKYAKAAPDVSDISDDECPTSLVIDTVDRELTSKPQTEPVDLSTHSTTAAENTISPLPDQALKRKLTTDLSTAPKKRVCSVSRLQPPSTSSQDSTTSQYWANFYQDRSPSPCPRSPSTSKVTREKQSLDQEAANNKTQCKSTTMKQVARILWKHQEQAQLEEAEEEEDKSPQ